MYVHNIRKERETGANIKSRKQWSRWQINECALRNLTRATYPKQIRKENQQIERDREERNRDV